MDLSMRAARFCKSERSAYRVVKRHATAAKPQDAQQIRKGRVEVLSDEAYSTKTTN